MSQWVHMTQELTDDSQSFERRNQSRIPRCLIVSRKILCSIWHNETLIQAKTNPDQYTVAQIPSKMHLWVKCVKLGSSVYFKYIKQVFRYKRTLSLTFSQLYQPNENVLPSVICDALQLHLNTVTHSPALKKSSLWTFLTLERKNCKVLISPWKMTWKITNC